MLCICLFFPETEPNLLTSSVWFGSVQSAPGRVSWVLFLIFNFLCLFILIIIIVIFCYCYFRFFIYFYQKTEPNLLTSSFWLGSARSGSVWVESERYIYIYIVLNICQKVTHSLVESVLSSLHLVLGSNLTYVIYFSS